jgi:hypothetical protein
MRRIVLPLGSALAVAKEAPRVGWWPGGHKAPYKLLWPDSCCCCHTLLPPGDAIAQKVGYSKTMIGLGTMRSFGFFVAVPYCSSCAVHAKFPFDVGHFIRIVTVYLLIAAGSYVALTLLAGVLCFQVMGHPLGSRLTWLPIGPALVVPGWLYGRYLLRRYAEVQAKRSPSCTTRTKAIRVKDTSGIEGRFLLSQQRCLLTFTNDPYASEFELANPWIHEGPSR